MWSGARYPRRLTLTLDVFKSGSYFSYASTIIWLTLTLDVFKCITIHEFLYMVIRLTITIHEFLYMVIRLTLTLDVFKYGLMLLNWMVKDVININIRCI